MAFEEYPKAVSVDGVTLIARDKAHEEALLAGKGDPQVLAGERARLEAQKAEAQKVADDATLKLKEADAALKDHSKAKAPEKKDK